MMTCWILTENCVCAFRVGGSEWWCWEMSTRGKTEENTHLADKPESQLKIVWFS